MSKKAICFHHSDTDGHCSGAIVRYFVKKKDLLKEYDIEDVKCVEIQYGTDAYKTEEINKDTIVFITDFSFPAEVMTLLVESAYKVYWFDHHEDAIKKLSDFEDVEGMRDPTFSASLLTWAWCSREVTDNKDVDVIIPPAVKLINDFDTWNHDEEGRAVTFEAGISIIDTRPNMDESLGYWESLFTINEVVDPENEENIKDRFQWDSILQTMNMGGICITYKNARSKSWLKRAFIRDVVVDKTTYKCYIFNGALEDSYCFDFAPETDEVIDAVIWYKYDGKKYTHSIRSAKEGVDVSEIARFYGGNGHPGSAGFITTQDIYVGLTNKERETNNKEEEQHD